MSMNLVSRAIPAPMTDTPPQFRHMVTRHTGHGRDYSAEQSQVSDVAALRLARLTPRERQVLERVLDGCPSKIIAADFRISQRTVEKHRAEIAKKAGTKSLSALIQLAISARCSLNNTAIGPCAGDAPGTMVTYEWGANAVPVASAQRSLKLTLPPSQGSERRKLDVAPRLANSKNSRSLASQVCQEMRFNMGEVQHRMKNMVAIIQSISHQTMRNSTTKSDFDAKFSGRLSAFCQSLDQLITNSWQGASVHELVRRQLAVFGVLDDAQIVVEGPDMILAPAATQNIALALHELATNALKYGSLSVPQGRVFLSWEVITVDGNRLFHMTWSEAGGPIVRKPERQGFGRKVIQHLTSRALGGGVAHDFLPEGVRWSLHIPTAKAVIEAGNPQEAP